MGIDAFIYTITLVLIPLAGLAIVAMIRSNTLLPQTCTSEVILLLTVFDCNIIVNAEAIGLLLPSVLQKLIIPIHVIFFLVGAVFLCFTIIYAEKGMQDHYHRRRVEFDLDPEKEVTYEDYPFIRLTISWMVSVSLIGGHALFFTMPIGT